MSSNILTIRDTLYVHGEQLVLYNLPLHVANDLEVFAQITATEIHDIKVLVFKRVGSLRLGDQLMRVEVSLDGFVLRVRVLLAEGEKHRIHKERLGLYLYTHHPPLSFPLPITRLRSCERPVSTTSQAYDRMTSAYSASRRVRNGLASRLCFCVGYTLAHHEATHGCRVSAFGN